VTGGWLMPHLPANGGDLAGWEAGRCGQNHRENSYCILGGLSRSSAARRQGLKPADDEPRSSAPPRTDHGARSAPLDGCYCLSDAVTVVRVRVIVDATSNSLLVLTNSNPVFSPCIHNWLRKYSLLYRLKIRLA
jgi:hypothetical protein